MQPFILAALCMSLPQMSSDVVRAHHALIRWPLRPFGLLALRGGDSDGVNEAENEEKKYRIPFEPATEDKFGILDDMPEAKPAPQ